MAYQQRDNGLTKKFYGKPAYRWNLDKPFYRRPWFWVWTVLLGAIVAFAASRAVHVWHFPCQILGRAANASDCHADNGDRATAALDAGTFALLAPLCLVGIIVGGPWAWWRLITMPEIRMSIKPIDGTHTRAQD